MVRSDHPTAREEAMHALQLELRVGDFDRWKGSFDDDPVGRERHGVRGHRVLRSVDDRNLVIVLLEFDSAREAETMRSALTQLWEERGDELGLRDAYARLVEQIETKHYTGGAQG
jgi:hypothetical protein